MCPNPLRGEKEEIETLVGVDEGICHADGVARMHVVVNVAMHEHKMPFEVACNLGIRADFIYERRVAFFIHFFLDSVVRLAPPTVVNPVVVVSGAGYGSLEEIGIFKDGCR